MSRYTGPRLKVMRALGVELPGLSRKPIADRPSRPGQHGARPAKKSSFGLQLQEKQKLRMNYGVNERQLRRLVVDAKHSRQATGEKLIELLERRLDNVVFRAGFAPTICAARQLVNHGHFRVNGRRVDIPSYRVRIGDAVNPHEKSTALPIIVSSLNEPALTRPEWISWDSTQKTARIAHLPAAGDVPLPVELQLVVEYYAQRL